MWFVEYTRGRLAGTPSREGTGTFTGRVLLDPVLTAGDTRINSVLFEPGGRTYWHSHDEGQVLLVAHGRGMVATRDGHQHELTAGDTVYAPPGEVHWHGAAPTSFMVHTAVSLGTTRWLDEVGDDDYKRAWGGS
jgi:quercetin dioxygenase-like cupin family protein